MYIAEFYVLRQNLHMGDSERYVDRVLTEVLERARKIEDALYTNRQSTFYRNFCHFDKGDRVSMTLSGIAINGIHIEETQHIEGILVNPDLALIDVKMTDGLEQWEGQTIGLGVCTYIQKDKIFKSFSKLFLGNGQVAYYLAEEIAKDSYGRPTIDDTNLHHLGLKYTKVTAGGMVITDFTNKP